MGLCSGHSLVHRNTAVQRSTRAHRRSSPHSALRSALLRRSSPLRPIMRAAHGDGDPFGDGFDAQSPTDFIDYDHQYYDDEAVRAAAAAAGGVPCARLSLPHSKARVCPPRPPRHRHQRAGGVDVRQRRGARGRPAAAPHPHNAAAGGAPPASSRPPRSCSSALLYSTAVAELRLLSPSLCALCCGGLRAVQLPLLQSRADDVLRGGLQQRPRPRRGSSDRISGKTGPPPSLLPTAAALALVLSSRAPFPLSLCRRAGAVPAADVR